MKPRDFIIAGAIFAEVLLSGACDGGNGGNNTNNNNNSGYSAGSVEGTLNGNPFFGPTPEGRNCYQNQNTQTGQITVVCY